MEIGQFETTEVSDRALSGSARRKGTNGLVHPTRAVQGLPLDEILAQFIHRDNSILDRLRKMQKVDIDCSRVSAPKTPRNW